MIGIPYKVVRVAKESHCYLTGERIRKKELAYAVNVWEPVTEKVKYVHICSVAMMFLEEHSGTLMKGLDFLQEDYLINEYSEMWEEFKSEQYSRGD